jgi:hypothetical protein
MSHKYKYDYQAAIDSLVVAGKPVSRKNIHEELCKMYPDKHRPYPWTAQAYTIAKRYNDGQPICRSPLYDDSSKVQDSKTEVASTLDAIAQQDQLYRTISALFASNSELQATIATQEEKLASLRTERTELLEAIQQLRHYRALPPPPPDVARAMAVFGR